MIKQQILSHIENNFSDTYSIHEEYRSHPYYCLIEKKNFLPANIVKMLSDELDNIPLDKCKKFTRKSSCMYEHNNLDETPIADAVVNTLHGSTFLNWLQKATGTVDLIPDPHLIGAGYAKSFTGDSLQVHTDFNWDDQLRLHRMLSVIIYLNDDWNDDWGGNLEFYDTERKTKINEVKPDNGNLLIWRYHNLAYHGYPSPMKCPKNKSRKNLRLFYYVSNASYDDRHPPHRSLYWFDDKEKVPYDVPWKK